MKLGLNRFIWSFICKRKFVFIALAILIVSIEIVETFMAQHYNRQIYNSIGIENINIYSSMIFVFLYVICQSTNSLVTPIRSKLYFESIEKTKNDIRNHLFNYVIKHSINYFSNNLSGDLNNKINSITDDFGRLMDIVNDMALTLTVLLLTPILYVNINIYLSLSFFTISIIYILALAGIRKELRAKTKILAETESKYIGFINDDFVNIQNIKLFAREKFEENKSDNLLNACCDASLNSLKVYKKFRLIHSFVVFLLLFTMLGIAGTLLANNKITLGTFMFCTIITAMMRYFLDNTSNGIIKYTQLIGTLENNLNKLLQPIGITNTSSKKLEVQNGKIEFKNIDFRY